MQCMWKEEKLCPKALEESIQYDSKRATILAKAVLASGLKIIVGEDGESCNLA